MVNSRLFEHSLVRQSQWQSVSEVPMSGLVDLVGRHVGSLLGVNLRHAGTLGRFGVRISQNCLTVVKLIYRVLA